MSDRATGPDPRALDEQDQNLTPAQVFALQELRKQYEELKAQNTPTQEQRVRDFNAAFSVDMRSTPGWPEHDVVDLRIKLINEEAAELLQAVEQRDLVETVDALVDLLYVTHGMLAVLGVDGEQAFAEVHRSNMAKIGGPVRADGKVLKPPGWKPPNLEKVLREQGWEPEA